MTNCVRGRHAQAAQTRQEVLDAARGVFFEHGYTGGAAAIQALRTFMAGSLARYADERDVPGAGHSSAATSHHTTPRRRRPGGDHHAHGPRGCFEAFLRLADVLSSAMAPICGPSGAIAAFDEDRWTHHVPVHVEVALRDHLEPTRSDPRLRTVRIRSRRSP